MQKYLDVHNKVNEITTRLMDRPFEFDDNQCDKIIVLIPHVLVVQQLAKRCVEQETKQE